MEKAIKQVIFSLLTLFSFNFSYAQKQANIWYFGDHAGVDFNSGSPVPLSNGALLTSEGCSSYCDSSGNILFYTDGVSVYNRLHNLMPNGTGLYGDFSTTQSALVIKQPGNANIYFIFTLPETGIGIGFYYSIVDMNLNGGNGDVINKNTIIRTDTLTEKLASVYHANGTDIWVAVHKHNSNEYLSYLLTSSGIDSLPLVSKIGNIHSGVTGGLGYMKFSPDGSKLAAALYANNMVDILDFNKASGFFYNCITYNIPVPKPYGIEFSPKGTYLYCSNHNGGTTNFFQLNMYAGSPAAILASDTLVHTSNKYGSMLLGPDKKIYFSNLMQNWLGAINNPETYGVTCNVTDTALNLVTGISRFGIPNFYSGMYFPTFNYVNTCFGDTTFFMNTDTINVSGTSWNFGDTASGINNVSVNANPYHQFTAPGTYPVQLIVFHPGAPNDSILLNVIIDAVPGFDLGNDTTICLGSSMLLNAGGGFSAYLWQDGTTDTTLIASNSGMYYVEIKNGTCIAYDTIQISTNICLPPGANIFVSDTSFCDKKCIDFFDLSVNGPTSWQWLFPGADSLTSNEQNPTGICYSNPGSFDVTLIVCNLSGCDTLFLPGFINEFPSPSVPLVTSNFDTLFSSPSNAYQWYNSNGLISGATNAYYVLQQPGNYYVVITDSNGCEATSAHFTTDVEESNGLNSGCYLYPDPNGGHFELMVTKNIKEGAFLIIYDVTGRIINNFTSQPIGKVNKIDLSEQANGIYILKLFNGNMVWNRKIVVNR